MTFRLVDTVLTFQSQHEWWVRSIISEAKLKYSEKLSIIPPWSKYTVKSTCSLCTFQQQLGTWKCSPSNRPGTTLFLSVLLCRSSSTQVSKKKQITGFYCYFVKSALFSLYLSNHVWPNLWIIFPIIGWNNTDFYSHLLWASSTEIPVVPPHPLPWSLWKTLLNWRLKSSWNIIICCLQYFVYCTLAVKLKFQLLNFQEESVGYQVLPLSVSHPSAL